MAIQLTQFGSGIALTTGVRSPTTAPTSSTCRCRRTSAPGSAIAAAGHRICGSSTSKTFASRNPHERPGERRTADVARQHDLLRLGPWRTERNNIWAMDVASGKARQVTQFTDFDISFPSIGGDSIVFQAGGRLYLLDCASEKATEVPIRVITDETTLRPRTVKADALIADASVSPTGRRAAFGTRGDVVTVPAENGAVVNLTRTSGVAERYPRWSPDGKMIAYWSDKSSESRADAARSRRFRERAEGHVARAGVSLYAVLVARQQETGVHRPGDEDSDLRRGRRPYRRRGSEP